MTAIRATTSREVTFPITEWIGHCLIAIFILSPIISTATTETSTRLVSAQRLIGRNEGRSSSSSRTSKDAKELLDLPRQTKVNLLSWAESSEFPSTSAAVEASIETFDIDLDQPPQERWNEVTTKYRNQTLKVMNWTFDKLIPESYKEKFIEATDLVEEFWPHTLQLKQEMDGIAASLDIAPGLILLLNLVYELSSACTSIIAQHSNGTIWHGRNLDFNIPNLQSIAVNVRFIRHRRETQKQGEQKLLSQTTKRQSPVVLYEGTTYVGLVGLFTGMKPGAFTLSEDQRRTPHGNIWENALEWIFKGGRSVSFLYREVLELAPDFDSAMTMLEATPLIAPGYIIVGGTQAGEGAVITRDRNGPADIWVINYQPGDDENNTNYDDDDNRWFLVETNDDHWLPPTDSRRNATIQDMKEMVSTPDNVSPQSLYKVLTTHPTFNELTTYTTIMSAQQRHYHTVIQYPPALKHRPNTTLSPAETVTTTTKNE